MTTHMITHSLFIEAFTNLYIAGMCWYCQTNNMHTFQYCMYQRCKCIPLWWLLMYFAYMCARVHQMIIHSGMQQQQLGTVTHANISCLLISRCLSRPRVALRYSVRTYSYFTS